MLLEVKPPQRALSKIFNRSVFRTVFLAGSIEMGKAEPWRHKVIKSLNSQDDNFIVFNPRRDDWDSSWEQTFENPNFYQQVNWEMDCIMDADIVLFYFDPKTKSPITLLELGMCMNENVYVCCPDGFWRKGNVEIVCERSGIPLVDNFDQFLELVKTL